MCFLLRLQIQFPVCLHVLPLIANFVVLVSLSGLRSMIYDTDRYRQLADKTIVFSYVLFAGVILSVLGL